MSATRDEPYTWQTVHFTVEAETGRELATRAEATLEQFFGGPVSNDLVKMSMDVVPLTRNDSERVPCWWQGRVTAEVRMSRVPAQVDDVLRDHGIKP